jgi:alanine racemase
MAARTLGGLASVGLTHIRRASGAAALTVTPSSTVTVDLVELERNARVLRGLISKGTKVCAVVKNNAFGHGVGEVSRALMPHVDMLGVVDNWEAQEIRDMGVTLPILRVRCASPIEVLTAPEGMHEPVGSLEGARVASSVGTARGIPVPVHLFVNIGDNRMSFNLPGEMEDLIAGSLLPFVDVVGIMAHVSLGPPTSLPAHVRAAVRAGPRRLRATERCIHAMSAREAMAWVCAVPVRAACPGAAGGGTAV